jgi:heat shock protein HslJ
MTLHRSSGRPSTRRTVRRGWMLLPVVVVVVVVAACGASPSDPGSAAPTAEVATTIAAAQQPTTTVPQATETGPAIPAGRYRAIEAQDASVRPPGSVERLSMTFDRGTIRIDAGCNDLMGSFTVDEEDRLKLTGARISAASCSPPEVMAMERWVLELVGQAPVISLGGDRLVLDSSDRSIVLVADG